MGKDVTVKGGRAAITALYAGAAAITGAGAALVLISVMKGVQFSVFSSQMPGYVFGAVLAFLGMRYLISVHKLQQQMTTSAGFSWSNFKRSGK